MTTDTQLHIYQRPPSDLKQQVIRTLNKNSVLRSETSFDSHDIREGAAFQKFRSYSMLIAAYVVDNIPAQTHGFTGGLSPVVVEHFADLIDPIVGPVALLRRKTLSDVENTPANDVLPGSTVAQVAVGGDHLRIVKRPRRFLQFAWEGTDVIDQKDGKSGRFLRLKPLKRPSVSNFQH